MLPLKNKTDPSLRQAFELAYVFSVSIEELIFLMYITNDCKMDSRKRNNMAVGLSIGLAIGAVVGVVVGIMEKDIALWLSIGIGSGMAFGVAIGSLIDNRRKR